MRNYTPPNNRISKGPYDLGLRLATPSLAPAQRPLNAGVRRQPIDFLKGRLGLDSLIGGVDVDIDRDSAIRQQAFKLLSNLTQQFGDVLPFKPLSAGFAVDGIRVPLLGPQGIFKPKVMELPLSITTSPDSPYDDNFTQDGYLRYRYRGTDPSHRDNVGLREAMRLKLPLIYLHGVAKGRYVAAWPVYVVGDNPAALSFSVAVDDQQQLQAETRQVSEDLAAPRRKYITSVVKVRLHQRLFRERVLAAYRQQCALCPLKHASLLEAAHIIPDADQDGEPMTSNGLSMCKIHHAAFDQNIIGIRPDYHVEVRDDILAEVDGPMLKYGIQSMHGTRIILPRAPKDRPDEDGLERRFEEFLAA